MDKFQREIEAEVQAVLVRTPFEIFGPKVPVAVDAETNDDIHSMKSLPPPLVPQSVLPVFDLTESSPGKKAIKKLYLFPYILCFLRSILSSLKSDNAVKVRSQILNEKRDQNYQLVYVIVFKLFYRPQNE